MFKLISILDRLLSIITKWAVQREQVKAQRNRDELHQNPADWFDKHFDSVSTDADKTNQADKADTSNTKAT
jgi:hypothetical protein